MPDTGEFQVSTGVEDGACVVTVGGDIDPSTAPKLEAELQAVVFTSEWSRLVLDLTAVPFCDSSGLRVLLTLQRTMSDRGGRLVLRGPTATVRRLLEVTALTGELEIE